MWSPTKGSRVCSEHFIDGVPTGNNSYPTENLGYESKRKVANILSQSAFSSSLPSKQKRRKLCVSDSVVEGMVQLDGNYNTSMDHSYAKENPNDNVGSDDDTNTNSSSAVVTCASYYYLFNYGVYLYVALIYFLVYRLSILFKM